MEVPVYNRQGKEVGSMTIDEKSLGERINHALLKQAYVMYHANTRQGSARTRSKSFTSGSTRKIYKQKGTGRARMGAVRTPVRRGGGHTFAKTRTREDYHQSMPVKMRRKANLNALLAKLIDNEVKVIDNLHIDSPRTKDFVAVVEALGIDRRALVALGDENKNARLSARNIDDVTTCPVHELTCFNMLNHRYLIIEKADLEAWLSGPSARTGKDGKRRAGKEAA
ncbi:MAG: 50S ribosomal protein L4 [Phycisphaeraceae bacterium]|nr:MAG: 50S ribosomal protein L4 [Phycisphaeraceae bacterium]